MSTIVRSWTVSLNNVPASQATLDAQAKSIIRALKDCIKLAGYTVEYSCDAVTAGTAGDGVDRWSADANLTWNAPDGTNAVKHSWFVLKRANGQLPNSKFTYILIDLSTGASSQQQIAVQVSSSAFSGGSTGVAPTATTANRQSFATKQFVRATVANSKFHFLYNTVGDWVFYTSVDGTGRIIFAAGSLISANYETGTNYPCIDFWAFADSATGALTIANLQSATHCVMFNPDGTAQTSGVFGPCNPSCGSNVMSIFTNTGSTISGKMPMVPVPIGQFSTTIAFKGVLVDVWFAPTGSGVNLGTEEPDTGTTTTCIVCDFWVPNGGGTLLL